MKSISIIAAHPDDEVLGCGGTLLKLKNQGVELNLMFLTDGYGGRFQLDEQSKNRRQRGVDRAVSFLQPKVIKALSLPDNQLDTISLLSIVREIEDFITMTSPDIVLTHYGEDLNIDHCVVYRATLTACRPRSMDNLIGLYAFEVPSSTEWTYGQRSFFPDTFVDISGYMDTKMEYLKCYEDEMRDFPHPRSFENVKALNQLRGASICVPYAEGFKTIRTKELNFSR